MQDAVSSGFVSLGLLSRLGGVLGWDFPQHSRRDQDVPSLPQRVKVSALGHSPPSVATPNSTALVRAVKCIVSPPHWPASALLRMRSPFPPQDKPLMIMERPPLLDGFFLTSIPALSLRQWLSFGVWSCLYPALPCRNINIFSPSVSPTPQRAPRRRSPVSASCARCASLQRARRQMPARRSSLPSAANRTSCSLHFAPVFPEGRAACVGVRARTAAG